MRCSPATRWLGRLVMRWSQEVQLAAQTLLRRSRNQGGFFRAVCAGRQSFSVASRRLGASLKREPIHLIGSIRIFAGQQRAKVMAYEASEEVIEQIWSDLHQVIPRRRVAEVARQVAAGFIDAKITAFIPLFVRRFTRERLLPEMAVA